MIIVCVGLSHHTAPVAIRERLAFAPNALRAALDQLAAAERDRGVQEAVLLTTCNRTELYGVGEDAAAIAEQLSAFLVEHGQADRPSIQPHLFAHMGEAAMWHLMRVAAGLDSMILGEAQILGQVQAALQEAQGRGAAGLILSNLFTAAVRAGRRARHATPIGTRAASVPAAAVALSGATPSSKIVIVGAGKMGVLTAEALIKHGARSIMVSNRSYARAVELADQWGGCAVRFDRLEEVLADADILISSTGAPHPVLRRDQVAAAMAARPLRPLTIVDIAVPRDVEPSAGNLPGVTRLDLDDLQAAIDTNLAERAAAVPDVERILSEETAHFGAWLLTLDVTPTIADLAQWADMIRRDELEKALRRLGELPPGAREVVTALSTALVKKLLHPPVAGLRAHAGTAEQARYAETVRLLFKLDAAGTSSESAGASNGAPAATSSKSNGTLNGAQVATSIEPIGILDGAEAAISADTVVALNGTFETRSVESVVNLNGAEVATSPESASTTYGDPTTSRETALTLAGGPDA